MLKGNLLARVEIGPQAGGEYNRSSGSLPPAANAGRRLVIPEREGTRVDLTLGPEAKGLRLDRALADRFPDHSRTVVAGWIREGCVEVNGASLPGKARLAGGEDVEVWIPPPQLTHLVPQDLPLDVLFEDEAILILNKAPGIAVHPGAGQPDGTIANALAFHLKNLPELGGSDRPGIVHRLDKETSGAMVVARTERAQRRLSESFAARRVEKTYMAVVHGSPGDDSGEVDAPIGRSPHHRTKMTVREDGKPASTAYSVKRRLPRHTLVACRPHTGRTHQIRVHMNHIGHPIAGDALYGRPGAPGEEHAPRLMLHALRLGFPHPESGETVSFEAPCPQDLRTALEALERLAPPRKKR